MSEFPRVIYFPKAFGDKYTYGYPQILYVLGNFVDGLIKATRYPEEAKEGRYGLYYGRFVAYTDQLWQLCLEHIKRRDDLEDEYDQLVKLTTRKSKKVAKEQLKLF